MTLTHPYPSATPQPASRIGGPALDYTPLERLRVAPPVRRTDYVAAACAGKRVLDLGCFDETAADKRDTHDWLHRRIAASALSVLGVDSSDRLPADGFATGDNSRIVRGDVMRLEGAVDAAAFDMIVAGELIEHLPDTLAFLRGVKRQFAGKAMVMTTPNATSLTNVLVGMASRESNHPDHLHVYSYKTLNTLLRRAGFEAWEVRPYHMYYAEMALRVGPMARVAVRAAETAVNLGERAFPLLSGGLIAHVTRI